MDIRKRIYKRLRTSIDLTRALALLDVYRVSLMEAYEAGVQGPEALREAANRLYDRMDKLAESFPEIAELEMLYELSQD